MQSIGEIISMNKNKVFIWTPPVETEVFCANCGSKMNAIKKFYKGISGVNENNKYKFEDRYTLEYVCPNNCKERLSKQKEHIERYRKAKKVWNKIGLSRECVGWTLDKMTCENIEFLKDYAHRFNRFSKAIVMKGYQGTGKTLSSECIAKYLTHKGKKCRITNMSEINIEMNKALRSDKQEEYMENLLQLDLIIIDDFGREQYSTEKSLENVFQFFNTLTKEKKPYIVSVNPEMLALMAEKPQLKACFDRFKNSERVTILNFVGKSFRQ